jgi:Zn-dependent M28 family amino/carboxypeptidase
VDTARSILFMCFSGEEQGLVGSRRYVEALQASGDLNRVRYMINLDMIGYAVDDTLATRIETIPAFASELNRFAAAAATYAPELSPILSSNTQAYSDHWFFLAAGVPGAFTWENGAAIYPHYHRATDVPANLLRGRELARGILKMDTAILAAEAGLLAPLLANGFED